MLVSCFFLEQRGVSFTRGAFSSTSSLEAIAALDFFESRQSYSQRSSLAKRSSIPRTAVIGCSDVLLTGVDEYQVCITLTRAEQQQK